MEFDLDLVLPNPELSFTEGLFAPLSSNANSYAMCQIDAVLKKYGYTVADAWTKIPEKVQKILLYGSGEEKFNYSYENMYGEYKEYFSSFEGVMPLLARRYSETNSDMMREEYESFMSVTPCPVCHGARLKPEVLAIRVGDRNIDEVTRLTIAEASAFFYTLELSEREQKIAAQILKELHGKCQ